MAMSLPPPLSILFAPPRRGEAKSNKTNLSCAGLTRVSTSLLHGLPRRFLLAMTIHMNPPQDEVKNEMLCLSTSPLRGGQKIFF